jgi:hypothetical protein
MKGRLYKITLDAVEKVRDLIVPPGLEELQSIVGGYIEEVPLFTVLLHEGALHPCVAFCNEMGKLHGLPRNHLATSHWQFALKYNGHPGLLALSGHEVRLVDFLVGQLAVVAGDQALLDAM